jgi:hypothetical protein
MEFESHLIKYNERLMEYNEFVQQNRGTKHTLVLDALIGSLNHDVMNHYCEKVISRAGNADFNIISLIRLLYLLNKQDDIEHSFETGYVEYVTHKIISSLNHFSFWPHTGECECPLLCPS